MVLLLKKTYLDNAKWFLPETILLIDEANTFAKEFIIDLKKGIEL